MNAPFDSHPDQYRVAGWRLDVAARELVSDHKTVRLEPLSLKVLLVLIENEGRVTSRPELVEKVWGRQVVTDDAFARQLAKLRAALAEEPFGAEAIETLPKTGLRLVAPVEAVHPVAAAPARRRRAVQAAVLLTAIGVIAASALWWFAPVPLEPAEVRPFTAELGEEVEPALSPDGRWAVYAARASADDRFSLYLRALADDSGRRITVASLGARRPAWSPSGRIIAFFARTDRGCWVVAGSPFAMRYRPIARCDDSGGGLAWLDEQRLIVADRDGYGAPLTLRLIELATRRATVLTEPPAGIAGDGTPLVLANGSMIYFVRTEAPGAARLMAMDLSGRRPRQLSRGVLFSGLARAPGGRLLVTGIRRGDDSGLWEVDPGSGEWRLLVPGEAAHPASSADGAVGLFDQSAASGAVWLQRLSTGQASQLTNSTRFDRQPALAPDRRRLAFISDRGGLPELWLRDMASGAERRPPQARGLAVTGFGWSPASDRIALAGRDERGPGLFMFDLRAARLERLRSEGSEMNPAFSSDGGRLFFTRRNGRRFSILERDVATGTERVIIDDGVRLLPGPGGTLMFVRPFEPGLWRFDPQTRRVDRFSDAPALLDRLNWTVAGESVWVADRSTGRLLAIGVHDGSVRETRPMPALAPSSGLSAVGDYLVYGQRSPPEADLFLISLGERR